MQFSSAKTKTAIQNFLLISCSLILALGASEWLLRMFFPKYQSAAENHYTVDSLLTWKTTPNTYLTQNHPDTLEAHPVIYNNHGLRQHRNITQEEFTHTNVISIFGDSFTENPYLPVQYGFTETLDYLLNSDTVQDSHLVLNFGVSGYGTDQAFIHYQSSPIAKQSAHVFYILCSNDLGDIYNNNLFTFQGNDFYINGADRLVQLPARQPNGFTLFLQNFYLTYLVLDALAGFEAYSKPLVPHQSFDTTKLRKIRNQRIENSVSQHMEDSIWENNFDGAARSMEIMNGILDEWKYNVEQNGGRFHIIILPNIAAHNVAAHLSQKQSILDLYEIFMAEIPSYTWETIRLKNDGHWAEMGNVYTAITLKQYIMQEEIDLSRNTKAHLQLNCYYQAFGNQWRAKTLPQSEKCLQSKTEWIRNRYIPLESPAFTALPAQKLS